MITPDTVLGFKLKKIKSLLRRPTELFLVLIDKSKKKTFNSFKLSFRRTTYSCFSVKLCGLKQRLSIEIVSVAKRQQK